MKRQIVYAMVAAAIMGAGAEAAGVAAAGNRMKADAAALLHSAWHGSMAELQPLIAAGADVNAADGVGDTALMRAAQRGNPDMVRVLLQAGANPNVQDKRGWTALMGACVSKNTRDTIVAKVLIEAGTHLELKNEHGFTALSYAAQSNKLDHVELLLAAGADVNSRDEYGRNVLHRAVMCKASPDVVRRLLAAGAVPQQVSPYCPGEDSFLFDAVYHQQSADVIQLLVAAGADVNSGEVLRAAAYARDARVLSVLLAAGADSNKGNPLAVMIFRRKGLQPVRELIAAGADVNRALSSALYREDGVNYLKLLLEKGADANYREEEGNTPFMLALTHANLAAAGVLLEAGAEPLAVNDAGKNALALLSDIRCVGLTGIRRWVAPGQANHPTLSEEAYTKLVRSLKALEAVPAVSRFAVWKAEQGKGAELPPLVLAAAQGDAARVAELLAAGADVNQPSPYTGRTPLMVAADWLAVDVVQALLAAGADVNRRDMRGNTALMYAQTHPGIHGGRNSVYYGQEPDASYACTEMLLHAGAEVLVKNDDGVSAMELCPDAHRARHELLRKAAAQN